MLEQVHIFTLVLSRGSYQKGGTGQIQRASKMSVPYLMWLNFSGKQDSFIICICIY